MSRLWNRLMRDEREANRPSMKWDKAWIVSGEHLCEMEAESTWNEQLIPRELVNSEANKTYSNKAQTRTCTELLRELMSFQSCEDMQKTPMIMDKSGKFTFGTWVILAASIWKLGGQAQQRGHPPTVIRRTSPSTNRKRCQCWNLDFTVFYWWFQKKCTAITRKKPL